MKFFILDWYERKKINLNLIVDFVYVSSLVNFVYYDINLTSLLYCLLTRQIMTSNFEKSLADFVYNTRTKIINFSLQMRWISPAKGVINNFKYQQQVVQEYFILFGFFEWWWLYENSDKEKWRSCETFLKTNRSSTFNILLVDKYFFYYFSMSLKRQI